MAFSVCVRFCDYGAVR
nr:hypothetical protein [Vibrio vulnificus]